MPPAQPSSLPDACSVLQKLMGEVSQQNFVPPPGSNGDIKNGTPPRYLERPRGQPHLYVLRLHHHRRRELFQRIRAAVAMLHGHVLSLNECRVESGKVSKFFDFSTSIIQFLIYIYNCWKFTILFIIPFIF